MTLAAQTLKEHLQTAVDAVREAACLLEGKISSPVVSDLRRDVKIEADQKLHEFLTHFLSRKTSLPVLSEEGLLPDQPLNGLQWIIDPIDGSVNYSRSIPFSSISIALWEDSKPQVGVVYDFIRKELFSGLVGLGAWMNDQSVKVSLAKFKRDAVLCAGFPVASDFSGESLSRFIGEIQDFKKIRLLGSAALSLAYVSSGRADMYRENSIALWDVAAGLALVKAGGGAIHFQKTVKPFYYDVIASNGGLPT